MKRLFIFAACLCGIALALLLAGHLSIPHSPTSSVVGQGVTNYTRMLSGVNYQTGTSYSLQPADGTRVVSFSNASGVSVCLSSPSSLCSGVAAASNQFYGAGSIFTLVNPGAGPAIITCSGCTINGSATVTLSSTQGADFYGDGVNFSAVFGGNGLVPIYCLAFPGTSMDAKIAAAISSIPSGSSAIIDCSTSTGALTWLTNPFGSLVGAGYSPSKTGVLKLCGANITESQSGTIPSGWTLEGCGIGYAGGNLGVTLQYNGPSKTTLLCTNTAASGTPLTFTATCASGLTANMQYGMAGACTAAAGGNACSGGTNGNSAYGNILSVNVAAQTMVILAPTTGGGTANNSNTTFVFFGCTLCLGDTSSITGGGNQNFKTEAHHLALDSNSISGAVPLYIANCSNLCGVHDLSILPSDNCGVLIDGSQAQNLNDTYHLWVVGASLRSGSAGQSAVGICNRMVGSSTAFSIHASSIALNGANSGAGVTYAMLVDAQGHYGPDLHILLGSGSGQGIVAANQTSCPVICFSAPGTFSGGVIEGVNGTGNSGTGTLVHVGSASSSINWRVAEIKTGAGMTNIFQDDNHPCTIPRASEQTLEHYAYVQGGLVDSSSQVSGCTSTNGINAIPAQIGDGLRYDVNGDSQWDAVNYAQKQVLVYYDFGSGSLGTTGASSTGQNPFGTGSNVNPTLTDSGAVTYTSSSSASTSTVIGIYQGSGGNYGDYGIESWYRWTLRFAASNATNVRYWMGMAVYFAGGTGNNGPVPVGNTAFATDTPNKGTIGFRYSASTDATWQACAITAGASSGSQTCTSTGVGIDTSPHTFEMTTTGTVVNYYIDHALVATVTTNLPPGSPTGNPTASMFWSGDNKNTANAVAGTFYWMSLSPK